jgi:hypothetical protein
MAVVAGSHKEEVLGILEAKLAGNHKEEAGGFKEDGTGSTSFEDKVQIDILLSLPYPTDQMYHFLNLRPVRYKW